MYRRNSCVRRSQRSRDCQIQICSWWFCAELLLLLLLLLLVLPLLQLLLLLLLRFCDRRASGGVALQLRCCCDVALVLRPYCSFHIYISVQQYTQHAELEFLCSKAPEPEPRNTKARIPWEHLLDQLLQENSIAKQVYEAPAHLLGVRSVRERSRPELPNVR